MSNHSFLFYVLPLSHTRTPRKSQNREIESFLVLAFCGAFHSEQVRSEFGQKVSLKSLAYANPHAPRHDIGSAHSKMDFSKYVQYWRGAELCPSCQPSQEKTFCAELP